MIGSDDDIVNKVIDSYLYKHSPQLLINNDTKFNYDIFVRV